MGTLSQLWQPSNRLVQRRSVPGRDQLGWLEWRPRALRRRRVEWRRRALRRRRVEWRWRAWAASRRYWYERAHHDDAGNCEGLDISRRILQGAVRYQCIVVVKGKRQDPMSTRRPRHARPGPGHVRRTSPATGASGDVLVVGLVVDTKDVRSVQDIHVRRGDQGRGLKAPEQVAGGGQCYPPVRGTSPDVRGSRRVVRRACTCGRKACGPGDAKCGYGGYGNCVHKCALQFRFDHKYLPPWHWRDYCRDLFQTTLTVPKVGPGVEEM